MGERVKVRRVRLCEVRIGRCDGWDGGRAGTRRLSDDNDAN
jgi:hypothetical protein